MPQTVPRHVVIWNRRLPVGTDDLYLPMRIEIVFRLIFFAAVLAAYWASIRLWIKELPLKSHDDNGLRNFKIYYGLLAGCTLPSCAIQYVLASHSARGNPFTPAVRRRVPILLIVVHLCWLAEICMCLFALVYFFGLKAIPKDLLTSFAYYLGMVLGVFWGLHLIALLVPMTIQLFNPFSEVEEDRYQESCATCLKRCHVISFPRLAVQSLRDTLIAAVSTLFSGVLGINRKHAYEAFVQSENKRGKSDTAMLINEVSLLLSTYFADLAEYTSSDILVAILLYPIFWKAKVGVQAMGEKAILLRQAKEESDARMQLDDKEDQEDLLLYASISTSLYGWVFYAYFNTTLHMILVFLSGICTYVYNIALLVHKPFLKVYRRLTSNPLSSNAPINNAGHAPGKQRAALMKRDLFPLVLEDSFFRGNYHFVETFMSNHFNHSDEVYPSSLFAYLASYWRRARNDSPTATRHKFKILYLNMDNENYLSPHAIFQNCKPKEKRPCSQPSPAESPHQHPQQHLQEEERSDAGLLFELANGVNFLDKEIVIAIRGTLSMADAWMDVIAAEEHIAYSDILLKQDGIGPLSSSCKNPTSRPSETSLHVLKEQFPLDPLVMGSETSAFAHSEAYQKASCSASNYELPPLAIHRGVATVTNAVLKDLLAPLKHKFSKSQIKRHGLDPEMAFLDFVLQVYPKHRLVVTGHSLGAGIASLLSLYLNHRYNHLNPGLNAEGKELRAVVYSPPGGCVSMQLALIMQHGCRYVSEHVSGWSLSEHFKGVVSIVSKKDLVSRLSISTLLRLRDDVKLLLEINRELYEVGIDANIEEARINSSEIDYVALQKLCRQVLEASRYDYQLEALARLMYIKYVFTMPKHVILYKIGVLRLTRYLLKKFKLAGIVDGIQRWIRVKILPTRDKSYLKHLDKYLAVLEAKQNQHFRFVSEMNASSESTSLSSPDQSEFGSLYWTESPYTPRKMTEEEEGHCKLRTLNTRLLGATLLHEIYLDKKIHVKYLPGAVYLIERSKHSYEEKKTYLIRYNLLYHELTNQNIDSYKPPSAPVRLFSPCYSYSGPKRGSTSLPPDALSMLSPDSMDYIIITRTLVQEHLPDRLLSILKELSLETNRGESPLCVRDQT